eukprot:TRINITY_DN4651_c0_g1_i1.p1 TRINITY_DN4651_c0_g1~~TRINITY_DN4651_c0_g1_i1.p1  ORF type:complete len:185 (+),score=46.09 TRINITY_DN4651_c0_g1_i1:45-599(+)
MAGNAPKSRGMIRYVVKSFLDSFKIAKREKVGEIIGRDPYGNIYYELPAQPQLGKRRPTRWYTAADKKNERDALNKEVWAGFDSDLPSEWESWLRFRRTEPPSDDEVMQSLAIAEMKKINAAKLEGKRIDELKAQGLDTGPPKPQDHEKMPYPKYEEFEIIPGDKEYQQKDRWEKYKNPYMKDQ